MKDRIKNIFSNISADKVMQGTIDVAALATLIHSIKTKNKTAGTLSGAYLGYRTGKYTKDNLFENVDSGTPIVLPTMAGAYMGNLLSSPSKEDSHKKDLHKKAEAKNILYAELSKEKKLQYMIDKIKSRRRWDKVRSILGGIATGVSNNPNWYIATNIRDNKSGN